MEEVIWSLLHKLYCKNIADENEWVYTKNTIESMDSTILISVYVHYTHKCVQPYSSEKAESWN